jgi:hypothetical protein
MTLIRFIVYVCIFWNYQQKGHKVELIDRENLEGEEHYKLKVILADSTEETWYLHAESFLETKMEGSMYDFDFRRYMPMKAFFQRLSRSRWHQAAVFDRAGIFDPLSYLQNPKNRDQCSD